MSRSSSWEQTGLSNIFPQVTRIQRLISHINPARSPEARSQFIGIINISSMSVLELKVMQKYREMISETSPVIFTRMIYCLIFMMALVFWEYRAEPHAGKSNGVIAS